MSRTNICPVPNSPPTSNPQNPYEGKVVYAKFSAGGSDACGTPEIVNSTGSLKMFGGAGASKKKTAGDFIGTDNSNSTFEIVNGNGM
ncbi:MAG: hypothetical protein QOK72_10625 [Nitrososphaeraceae archaeon]|nr:hypothetical protein [Nitrososphaeraceae archaeon]